MTLGCPRTVPTAAKRVEPNKNRFSAPATHLRSRLSRPPGGPWIGATRACDDLCARCLALLEAAERALSCFRLITGPLVVPSTFRTSIFIAFAAITVPSRT